MSVDVMHLRDLLERERQLVLREHGWRRHYCEGYRDALEYVLEALEEDE